MPVDHVGAGGGQSQVVAGHQLVAFRRLDLATEPDHGVEIVSGFFTLDTWDQQAGEGRLGFLITLTDRSLLDGARWERVARQRVKRFQRRAVGGREADVGIIAEVVLECREGKRVTRGAVLGQFAR